MKYINSVRFIVSSIVICKDCKSCLEYIKFKDNLSTFKSLKCNKNLKK